MTPTLYNVFYWYFLSTGRYDAVLKGVLLILFAQAIYFAFRKMDRVPEALVLTWLWVVLTAAFEVYHLTCCATLSTLACMREMARAFMLNFSVALTLTALACLLLSISAREQRARRTLFSLFTLAITSAVFVVVWAQLQFTELNQLMQR